MELGESVAAANVSNDCHMFIDFMANMLRLTKASSTAFGRRLQGIVCILKDVVWLGDGHTRGPALREPRTL